MLKNATINALMGWAMLTILVIAVTIVRLMKDSAYLISLTIAALMFIVLVYLLILRRIDGPSFFDSLNDERLRHISVNAQRSSFWFLFVAIWCLAAVIEFFNPAFLKEYISLCLASIGTVGLFIYMFSFIWQKYRVRS